MKKPEKPHYLEYCDLCQRDVVICGQCGNNSCNGGVGEIMGPNPGDTLPCPFCDDAYKLDSDNTLKK